jgi:hypothetical protein
MYVLHKPHLLPSRSHAARRWAVWLLCLAPFLSGLLALALGQDANWDLRNYHFYNAYAFLNDRYAMDLLPSQTPYFYNPLMDLPLYWLATHAPARVVGFTLGFVQGFNFILLFMLAHALLIIPNARHKTIACLALAALGYLGGGGIAQIGTTFGDNINSLGVLFTTALIVRHLERLSFGDGKRAFALMILFGLMPGMMMGLKLPAVTYCVGLCGALLFVGGSFARRFVLAFGFGCGVLIGLTVTLGGWAHFLDTQFGSPLFPYFNDLFQSPLAPLTSARDTQFVPRSLRDALLMPFIFADSPFRVREIEWRDWRIPIAYVLLPLAAVVRFGYGRFGFARGQAPLLPMAAKFGARYLIASCVITYALWLVMFNIYRYAVPLEMVAPLVIVAAVGMLPLSLPKRGLIAALLLAVISASIIPGNWGRKAQWGERFVEADIPPLGDTSNLMILMAGYEPYSHVVPLFPPEIKFVRVQSNFASPDQGKGINRLIAERIDAHKAGGGRFMLLIPDWKGPKADRALTFFGLTLMPQSCQTVVDRLYLDTKLNLCPVIQTPNAS